MTDKEPCMVSKEELTEELCKVIDYVNLLDNQKRDYMKSVFEQQNITVLYLLKKVNDLEKKVLFKEGKMSTTTLLEIHPVPCCHCSKS